MSDYISRAAAVNALTKVALCVADSHRRAVATERTRWIPCSERLPEDGQYVLCWYQYFRYGNYNRLWQTYGIGFQYNGNWGGEVSTGRDTKVLFWMPLPEPPEEEE